MNKKDHRLVGTINSKKGMRNLIDDLENAKMLSFEDVESYSSQPLTQSTSYIKKPFTEKKETTAVDGSIASPSSMQYGKKIYKTYNSGKKNFITKSSQPEHYTHKIESSQLMKENQLLQNCVTISQCDVSEQTTDRNFQIKDSNCLSANKKNNNITEDIIKVFKELFQKLNQRLDIMEKKESENHAMLLQLIKTKNRRVQLMPKCLPFQCIESFLQFDNANNEIYDEVVNYFIYLGGLNPIDCAAIYFKCAFENVEKISLQVTWHGTKDLKPLKVTCFAQACEDAMNSNLNFSKPRRDEFEDAMIKALKSTKERFRRQQKRHLEKDELKEPSMRRAKMANMIEEKENTNDQFINCNDAWQQIEKDEEYAYLSNTEESLNSPAYNDNLFH